MLQQLLIRRFATAAKPVKSTMLSKKASIESVDVAGKRVVSFGAKNGLKQRKKLENCFDVWLCV